MRPAIRHLSQALGLLLLAAAIGYTVALVMVLVVSQQDERRQVDAIIVLGAAQYNGRPSPVLRARLTPTAEQPVAPGGSAGDTVPPAEEVTLRRGDLMNLS